MSTTRLFRITSNCERSFRFFRKSEILTHKNLIYMYQPFLCSANDKPKTDCCTEKELPFAQMYYRNYLLNNCEYANLIFCEDTKTNSKTAAVLNQLNQDNESLYLKNELSIHLNEELSQLSFNEFCEVTFLILKLLNQINQDPFWEDILEEINKECLGRASSWSKDEKIKMTDILMMLPKFLKCKKKLLYKLLEKSAGKHQIIFLYYFLMRTKLMVPKEYKFNLQMKTEEILPEINSTEAGIICEGFLRSSLPLLNICLLPNILKKALEEVETINAVPFVSVCKFARVFSRNQNSDGIPEFQEKAIKAALKLGTKHIINLAQTGESCNYLDSNLRNILMKEVKDHISELPLFYIERVAYISTVFKIYDEEFLKLAVGIFESIELTENTRRLFLFFLTHLLHYRMYPKNLFDRVFNQEFLDIVLGEKQSISAWWNMYCSLQVERPEFIAIDLAPQTRKKIHRKSQIGAKYRFPRHYKILWTLKAKLEELFGEETVKFFMPLPQYPLGLLMKFDKNSRPQKLLEDFRNLNKTVVIKSINDDYIWKFIFISYSLNLQIQIRQLNAIGYVPVPVNKNFVSSNEEGNNYLRSLIDSNFEFFKDQKGAVTN